LLLRAHLVTVHQKVVALEQRVDLVLRGVGFGRARERGAGGGEIVSVKYLSSLSRK